MPQPPAQHSFFNHLEELRARLLKSFLAVAVGAVAFYGMLDPFFHVFTKPVGTLVFTSPGGAFQARMLLTLLGGFLLALPVILYQVWSFVALGLTARERRSIMFFGPFSLVCFFAGAAFGFLIMLPIALDFLLGFGSQDVVPLITIDQYMAFAGMLVLGGGVIFELPLVLLFLYKIGIATREFLCQQRKYAIVGILVVSALLTPPDVITQILMALPLMLLYEAGIGLIRLAEHNNPAKLKKQETS